MNLQKRKVNIVKVNTLYFPPFSFYMHYGRAAMSSKFCTLDSTLSSLL